MGGATGGRSPPSRAATLGFGLGFGVRVSGSSMAGGSGGRFGGSCRIDGGGGVWAERRAATPPPAGMVEEAGWAR